MAEIERASTERVARIVREVLRQQFDGLRLVSVEVEEGRDAGGDPVLEVIVVYEPGDRALDVARVVGFVRHLRPALAEIGEERFPVVSYIPADEFAETA